MVASHGAAVSVATFESVISGIPKLIGTMELLKPPVANNGSTKMVNATPTRSNTIIDMRLLPGV